MWSEIKKLVSSKARSNPVNCDISPDRFNSHFINITKNLDCNFKNKPDNFLWKGPKSRYVFKFHHISFQDIQLYLNSMTNKHGNDILGMDIKLLKIACPVISKSLAYVVNSSLDNGIVHDDWKKARVTPVYKNEGEINDENNFRPISVISHIEKMIERFVSDQIIKYLEDHAFISIDQSAYLKRHSTQTSLHRVIDDWLEQIHDNSLTGACLLGITKCFDSINHEMLLKKLEMYGITGNELDWFSSYLKNRKQMVFFQEDSSDFQEVYSGVPQGSVLGPLLFLLFINDVANSTTEGCALNMYADDVIIYTSAETSDELQMKLQLCFDNVHQWYNMNRLTVNKKKSAVMVIGSKAQLQSLNLDQFSINLDSNKIEFVNKAKYLGLLVKDDLSWDDHILQLCKTMNYYVNVLRRLNKIFPKQLLLKIYKSYVQSNLDYGLSIWGCTTEGNLDRVQRIQNFCARIMCKNYDYINTRGIDLVNSLKIQTIRQRRDYFLSVLMFKAIHGLAPHYLCNDVTMVVDVHGYNTRSSENMNLYVPKYTKEICKRSFAYKGSMLWNDLPDEVKESSSLDAFKSNYRFYIG